MSGIYDELPDTIQEVDVIIAGGGTAGCVIAGRLAEANSNLSVLVIEGGPSNLDVPTITHPALFLAGLMPTSKHTLFYQGTKENQLGDRELIVPSGGTLGGGSSINLMMYSRAQRSDFNSWNVPGWSTEDMIPYLKKLETYHGSGPRAIHGFDGPINVSRGTYSAERSESDFVQAAGKVGFPEIEDLASLDANNGIQRALRYIGTDGTRQDTARGYIHPKIKSGQYPNLHVVVNSRVKRIIFDNKRACGVEYTLDPQINPGARLRTIRTRKMVIVSSGALGTPSILERSGVGNPEILRKAGVDVVVDLPGVGENYQDHHLLTYPYLCALDETETIDALVGGRLDVGKLIQDKAPILGWNAMDITYKIRPTDEEVAALGSNFQAMWNKDYKNKSDKPLASGSLVSGFPGDPSLVPAGQYFAMSVFTGYPQSRGSIHISGPESADKPTFTTGFFSDAQGVDIKKHVWAYKKHREISRRMKTYRGELALSHPPFSPSSGAALVQLSEKPAGEVTDIVYTSEDDKVIEEYLRGHVGTTWHSLGTCKMGPREEKGVVDASLSVYGVHGLKIADLSIPPLNVAANTMNTAVAIAEKAADIFIKELGL
ncbi:GMC oxidoreductase-domain-containing protein [Clohesyomyces aquaticus]|uniref:GMC oxidoreductase-domain-containing protein n=1 Tax=Clohesyomyces aquaticus TaxID=1231657 RepID=A0A1Y1Z2R7_9PLEO|nr:GMC oxidoreductase-domain-containing protein [Clohesyomyces aquaticus]